MSEPVDVFLSYSRNDLETANALYDRLSKHGLTFKDDKSIREGDLWLDKIQTAVDACGAFVIT